MFLLVPAYPGCPGQTAVKWLLLLYRRARKGSQPDSYFGFRHRIALNGVVVESEFDTSVSNENYESLIDHLSSHISNAVRRQLELNGYKLL